MLSGADKALDSKIKGWDWLRSECERVLADIRAEKEKTDADPC